MLPSRPRFKSLRAFVFVTLVVVPIGGNLFVFAMVAIRARAPLLFWPVALAEVMAIVLLGGMGDLRPYPPQKKQTEMDVLKEVLGILRGSGLRLLGLLVVTMVGLFLMAWLAHLLAPFARQALRSN